MEALTRLVADSLARHGFDRPVDPRRLQWSRWSRCDSPHSLLVVPSKPGIFALAEEIMDLAPTATSSETGMPCGAKSTFQAPISSPEGTAFISPGRKSGVGAYQGTESRRDGTNNDTNSDPAVSKTHAGRPPVLRRRRHGLHPRSHVHLRQSYARPPRLRPLLPPLRRHRRPGPAPQHLQRP